MKKTLCLYFQVHLPFQLRRYRFFDIGVSHQYYDDFNNRNYIQKVAEQCYLPMNELLLSLIKKYDTKFKIAFSITGDVIEQMELYAPKVLQSFQELASTGCVEFICETYSHSLVFLRDEQEFENQIKKHAALIKKHFNQEPTTVRLTGLIYSDQIGSQIAEMGFETMITEGAKLVLGWKSPNYVYTNNNNSELKILLRNPLLSDRISFKFSDHTLTGWPVTCEKVVSWLNGIDQNEEVVNIFMDYLTFGCRHTKPTGIFDFLECFPGHVLADNKFEFLTPREVTQKHKAVAPIQVPYPISWAEHECDLSVWLGNDLQQDAFTALCDLGDKVRFLDSEKITIDWERLQDSDHFYFMCTRLQSSESDRRFRTPYNSPYDAYINYMNVLSDLILRIDTQVDEKIHFLLKDKALANKVSKLMIPQQYNFTPSQIEKIIDIIRIEQEKQTSDKKKENCPDLSLNKN